MSVLSSGLARLAMIAEASAMVSSVSFLPFRYADAFSTRNGREAAAPSATRASSIVFAEENLKATATPRIGKSKAPRRRSFQ
jgi:hypothetical protein